ncbi:MAG: sodium:solute symporter [Pirellulales bacterium]
MLSTVDLFVLVGYLVTVVGIGLWLGRHGSSPDEYMAAGRSLPGWAVGLSMFGSYVSSISFLANPGKAYADNWNPFVFSIATPIAAAVAVRWFMPFYRHTGEVSAYEHLERRFGPWARTYAVVCFLLYQMARMGTVIYLLALAVAPLTGWRVEVTILATGALMTFYTLVGGIKAVVWTGVLQSAVLVAGTLLCLASIVWQTPGGLREIVATGVAEDKFSLGSFGASLTTEEPTFWVMLFFGLFTHLTNFGIDQSYVQRYITARDDREAAKSIWITAVLYLPVAAIFFFIGTGLYVFYKLQPGLLGAGIAADKVFPHFIKTQLPLGAAGLVVAGIFAASMDSNLNSMATLTFCDIYQRYLRPQAGQRESMFVLYLATFVWGLASVGIAFAMIRVEMALDAWWNMAGVFSGGVLGLFLLGLLAKRADNVAGAIGVVVGVLVIFWMTLPTLWDVPPSLRNPLNANLTIVVGTLTIFLVGLAVSRIRAPARANRVE